jgi:hypothetical protein
MKTLKSLAPLLVAGAVGSGVGSTITYSIFNHNETPSSIDEIQSETAQVAGTGENQDTCQNDRELRLCFETAERIENELQNCNTATETLDGIASRAIMLLNGTIERCQTFNQQVEEIQNTTHQE